MASQFHEELE